MSRDARHKSWFAVVAMALTLTGCATLGPARPPLETVESLDIDRYLGQWYVIANIPYFAERGNVASRVIYAAGDGEKMDDLYYYREAFGEPEELMRGKAWVVDERTNARWKTRFYWPFTFDYYVLAITPEYDVVAVGHPSREYAWIMARERTVSDEDYATMLAEFERQGWDTSLILKVPQFPEQSDQPGFQS